MNVWQLFLNASAPVIVGALIAYYLRDRFNAMKDDIKDRFAGVDRRFDAVDERIDAVDRRFDAVDRRFDAVDARLDRHETSTNERFAQVDARLNLLTGEVAAVRSDIVHVALAVGAQPQPRAS